MNSRSSVNETNLVNFSTDLSTLNQLDSKDGLLSFPFDHIYACHSESADRRASVQLDKEVEISSRCVISEEKDIISSTTELTQLTSKLTAFENQNKKLKDLLVYHLDLIQQQNEIITKRDKSYQTLKLENDSLKTRLSRMERRLGGAQRSVNPPPLVHAPSTVVSSTVVKSEPKAGSKIVLNTFTEVPPPDKKSFIFESDRNKNIQFGESEQTTNKSFVQESLDLPITETEESELNDEDFIRNNETDDYVEPNNVNDNKNESWAAPSSTGGTDFLQGDVTTSAESGSNLTKETTMIESKPSFVKKEIKTEARADAFYTISSYSGNAVVQRVQRTKKRTTTISSINRFAKIPKVEPAETSSSVFDDDKNFERDFSVNKKSKMINTYGKNRNSMRKTSQFTGSLADRLQLIDTTPTGEDPYQLREADMREQSPIPKLMLQKTHHGKMKICTETGETTTRRIYEPIPETYTKATKTKVDRFNLTSTYMHTYSANTIKKESPKTPIVEEPDLDIVKTEPEVDWCVYNKTGNETSLCDFSYGEDPGTIGGDILPSLDSVEFNDLFQTESPLNLDNIDIDVYTTIDKNANDKSKRRAARTSSLVGSLVPADETMTKAGAESKRGRKRALSTTGLAKGAKRETAKGAAAKPKVAKGKAACRGKKSPVPGVETDKPYHTSVGDPDLSWYFGLNPDVKLDDIAPSTSKASTVEVPRWREKLYTSIYTLEGTEDLDDRVFEKRHQKLEAEERRQLRWHMRRIREQRHVERLRQRQRDSWMSGNSPHHSPSFFTIWPQPQRDLRFIEITDTLPVLAFGETMPSLPEADFVLPWVRTSKAQKKSKRTKTLH